MSTLTLPPNVCVPMDWVADCDDELVDALMLFQEPSVSDSLSPKHLTINPVLTDRGHNADGMMLHDKDKAEDRRAKHREVQRRFMKRKQAEFAALKSRALRMELQYKLLLADAEMEVLLEEQKELQMKLNAHEELGHCRSQSRYTSINPEGDTNKKQRVRLRFELPRDEN